jgi:hypothetical protein
MRDNYVWMECKGSIYTALSILNPLVQFTPNSKTWDKLTLFENL